MVWQTGGALGRSFQTESKVEYVNIGPSNGASNSHCTIAATATVLPPYTMTREDVKYYMGRVFDIPERRLEALMSIADNAHVNKSYSIFPIGYTGEPRPLSNTNDE